ncbi:unnamed protein product [Fraxinus pennsylvanica]|uniref:Uncharacterized protein n=1 Tax=Fraxinus pennsylvanica TaxID=56036 RepID=A0AAD2A0Q6_9LAMI|nr:unnamed protein product [Fraxinus pennsylvanica]
MAAISSVLSLTPGTGLTKRTGLKHFAVPGYLPSLKRNVNFRVSSMAEDTEKDSSEPKAEPSSKVLEPAAPPKAFPLKPKVSTNNFGDILAFSGPGPERINGRLAMIGFVTAIGVELANGVGAESKSNGVFTSDAELWNGRFAMVGLVALAFTEYVIGGALV